MLSTTQSSRRTFSRIFSNGEAALGAILDVRRATTKKRFDELAASLAEAEKLLAEKACVYATGSVARGEVGEFSDLDLFIVGYADDKGRKLSRLDEIIVKADLIKETDKHDFPPFSGDGKYLEHYTVSDLCEKLGKAEDDHANTFTARLLLLLESRPLLGSAVYERVIDDVIEPYWRDFEGRKDTFRPVFLMNDIVRLWKTFCVNYEAYTEQKSPEKRAKRRLKNYKLKNSRVLTCYSAILYLLQEFSEHQTVSPIAARAMVKMTPTERLEWLAKRPGFKMAETIDKLICEYEQFLDKTNQKEESLLAIFVDNAKAREFTKNEWFVGDRVMELLEGMGPGNPLFRFLVI
jgi:predicted nucleotidyltransferase